MSSPPEKGLWPRSRTARRAVLGVALLLLVAVLWWRRDAPGVLAAPPVSAVCVLELERAVLDGSAGRLERIEFARGVLSLARSGHPDAGEAQLLLASSTAAELGERDLQAELCVRIGYLYNELGRLEESVRWFEIAAERALSPDLRIYTLATLVDPLLQIGRFGRVEAAMEEAATIFGEIDAPTRLTELRLRQGQQRAYIGLGLNDRVFGPLQRLEELAREELADPRGKLVWQAIVTIARLDWLNRTERFGEARALGAALDPVIRQSAPKHAPMIDMRVGVAASWMGDVPAAKRCFLAVAENPDSAVADRKQAETRLAAIELKEGRLEQARAWLAKARGDPGESDPVGSEGLENVLFRVAIEHRAGRVGLAALARAVARYLEAWRSAEPRPGGLAVVEAGRQRAFLIELMGARMAVAPGEAGSLAALEALFQVQELGSLSRSLRDRSSDASAAVPTLAEVRGRFTDTDSGCLAYFPGEDAGWLIAFDAREVRCVPLVPELELRARQRDLAAWMMFEPPKDVGQLSRRAAALARVLLPGDVAELLERWNEVAVVGLGHLGPIPFELLPLAGGRMEERMAVEHWPSLPAAGWLARRPAPDARPLALALVAAPELAPEEVPEALAELPPLPVDDERLERLLGGLDPRSARVRAGKADTFDAVASAAADGALILHVVAHAHRDESREREVVLVLSDREGHQRLLGCSEVEALRVPPIVILSACGALQGHPRAGDDRASDLSGAFLRAGAQVVIVAPFELEYRDACALGGELIMALRRGESCAQALRSARARFLASTPGADPSRAFLQVIGLGQRVVF